MEDQKYRLQVVTTQGVNAQMAESAQFAANVETAISKFLGGDWGDSKDKALNDSDPLCALGVYAAHCSEGKIWIKSDDYREFDGSRVVTVLFPSEY